MRQRKWRALVIFVVMAGTACSDGPAPDARGAAPSSPAVERRREVPDVEGVDVRRAIRLLRAEGFTVRFASGISAAERRYASGAATHPTMVVARTRPTAGAAPGSDRVVTIVALRCPGGRRAC